MSNHHLAKGNAKDSKTCRVPWVKNSTHYLHRTYTLYSTYLHFSERHSYLF